MTFTIDDLVKISQEMNERKEQTDRDFFACFEKADFDRGDKIVLSQAIADGIKLLNYDKDRVSVSRFLEPGSYIVLAGETKKPRLDFDGEFFQVLKDPKPLFRIDCS
ncbi:hypothetical protein A9Q81_11755 [Gammaproteobacteria bacterium 42_54_T18]|nr:hypothetical protein A9Q81_11755 [Gammaproteobacteria bacterium 42_54_T18]